MISSKSRLSHDDPQNVGLIIFFVVFFFLLFVSLGTWQLARLSWKLELIASVNHRVHSKEVAAPSINQWPQLNSAKDEYRRVRVSGKFIGGKDTLVQAVTKLGSGFWVLTPLRVSDGTIVMINRGFIPSESSRSFIEPMIQSASDSTVTGLLRMSQPNGAFLRKNDPINHRWYSRDVGAIAGEMGLHQVAPYFLDADAVPSSLPKSLAQSGRVTPVGGLTVISFHNNHLVYALTWYALATMVAGAAWYFFNTERRYPSDLTAE